MTQPPAGWTQQELLRRVQAIEENLKKLRLKLDGTNTRASHVELKKN